MKSSLLGFTLFSILVIGCGRPEWQSGENAPPPEPPKSSESAPVSTPPSTEVTEPKEALPMTADEAPRILEAKPSPLPAWSELGCDDPLLDSALNMEVMGRSAIGLMGDLLGLGPAKTYVKSALEEHFVELDKEYYFFRVCRYRASTTLSKPHYFGWLANVNPEAIDPSDGLSHGGDQITHGSLEYLGRGETGKGGSITPIDRKYVQSFGGYWNQKINFQLALIEKPKPDDDNADIKVHAVFNQTVSFWDLKANTPHRYRFVTKDEAGKEDIIILVDFWKGNWHTVYPRELYKMIRPPKPQPRWTW